MDVLKNVLGQDKKEEPPREEGFMDKLNSLAGGGRASEEKEDTLDKAIDFVQEKFLGQGPQDNESAFEQAKDRQIADFIRGQFGGNKEEK